jgi:hypothetical protein
MFEPTDKYTVKTARSVRAPVTTTLNISAAYGRHITVLPAQHWQSVRELLAICPRRLLIAGLLDKVGMKHKKRLQRHYAYGKSATK